MLFSLFLRLILLLNTSTWNMFLTNYQNLSFGPNFFKAIIFTETELMQEIKTFLLSVLKLMMKVNKNKYLFYSFFNVKFFST